MNKSDLVDDVAKRSNVTKKEVDSVISATTDAIIEAVADGEKVTLIGFGSFEKRDRQPRQGRNPKTGDKMEIPATVVPAFSAGKFFKQSVERQAKRK
jgi:DNA-binding protein HU-beta